MSDIEIGVNLEFFRSSEKSFHEGIKTAAALGYKYCEPCVATGYDLLVEPIDHCCVNRHPAGEILARKQLPGTRLYSLAWATEANELYLGTDDNRLRLLYARTLDVLLALRGHDSYLKSLAVRTGTGAVYSGSGNGGPV